ncbi:alpha/beta fold hydrolase [Sphingomonas sp. ST-64]|uniref:Alpha/beta fold hydrolase n=1 Tax=Sphingomonas plantiphila TaxID=3163295 RepID=A0ABW8YJC7_9SPHN
MSIEWTHAVAIAGLIMVPASQAQSEPTAMVRPARIVETAVKLGQGQWAVDGVLTVPPGRARRPAIVLVHGSGPGTMDMNVGGSTIFRDLAWGFAARGIAVIRYNKRPTQHAAAFKALGRKPTLEEEYLEEAASAVAVLRRTPGVDPKRIYILGNSMGATLAALIANRTHVAGMVAMAGSPRPIGDILIEQATYGLSIAKDEKERKRAEEVIANGKRLNAITPESDPDEIIHGSPVKVWRELMAVKPVEQVRALSARHGRALILHGDRDYLITEADWQAWQPVAVLPGVRMHRFPKLNHIMQEGEGKMTFEEYRWTRPASIEFIDYVAAWVGAKAD